MPSANAANRLIRHYLGTARRLPWRVLPGDGRANPYHVWLSEVMLQQTTVAAVVPRFTRFVQRWPTIDDLAGARDEDILSEWAGLGYYARARNLVACAREIARLGRFPETAEELCRLPGIGDYTAAAIAAIAFGERVAAVDTNVRRVGARLFGMSQALPGEIGPRLHPMLPTERPGDFIQAMMDLGATICRPRAPDCHVCPLMGDCAAFASGDPERFPATKVKAARPQRYGVAHWIEENGMLWLVRRPSNGLLGGMAALPGPDWQLEPAESHGPPLGRIRHSFTHFTLDLTVVAGSEPYGDGGWQPLATINDAGLPTLYRKAVQAVLAARRLDEAA